jgi:transposase-like protein
MMLTCPRCKSSCLSIKAELASVGTQWLGAIFECEECHGLFSVSLIERRGAVFLEIMPRGQST